MLYLPDGSTRITPAYDVVPQTHLDSDGKMALAVNGKYLHAAISVDDLIAEAEMWKLRSPGVVVRESLEAVASFVRTGNPLDNAYPGLQDDIIRYTGNLLAGRPTGASTLSELP